MNWTYKAALAAAVVAALGFGCEKKGAAEKLGESVDQAAEEIKEAVTGEDDRADDVVDKAKELVDEVKEAASD